MTGDRRLDAKEKNQFIQHELVFLDKTTKEGGEPSLYDAALIEAKGALDAHHNLIISLATQVRHLEAKVDDLARKINR